MTAPRSQTLETKTCKCGFTGSLRLFYPRGSYRLSSKCPTCRNDATRRRYYRSNRKAYLERSRSQSRDRDRVAAYWQKWRLTPTAQASRKAARLRRRARSRGADGSFAPGVVPALRVLQGGRCFYCDDPLGDRFDVDHIMPLSKGGSNWPGNLALACRPCNLSKGRKLPLQWATEKEKVCTP